MKTLDLEIEPKVGGEWFKYLPESLSLKTERMGTPATLTGTIPDAGDNIPEMGATVRLTVDGVVMFYGRVFACTVDRWGVVSFTAYDLLRYLKGNFSWYERGLTVEKLINVVASTYDIPLGDIASTGYTARCRTIQDECALDAIQAMIDLATVKSKTIWVLFDDCGKLCLRSAQDMTSDVLIGDSSLATDYSLAIDIDTDTYNHVIIHRPLTGASVQGNKIAKDTSTEAKWGRLIYYEEADEKMNAAQMQEKADNLLKMKNRPTRALSIDCFGVAGIRAGMMVTINFNNLPEVSKKQVVVLDSVEHTFEDSLHMMHLETRTLWESSP